MIVRIRHIALILTLLLLGGMGSEVWAVKVTYHVLTMPFTPRDKDGVHNYKAAADASRQNIRVEAFYVIVDETSPTVGLPSQFVSPLAKNFRYYQGTTTSESGKVSVSASRVQIYEYNNTTYNTYTIHGTTDNADVPYYTEPLESYTGLLLKPGSAIASDCDIYVTYEYDPANTVVDLTGNKSYNIKLGDRFLAFNKGRANRPAAILASKLKEENLNSDDFTYVANPDIGNSNYYYHFRFKFDGPDPNTHDPYNITIYTAYNGDETFFSDTNKNLGEKTIVLKSYKDSRLFCKGSANGGERLWLSSDYDLQFTQTNKNGELTWESQPGYYRGGVNNTSEMSPIWNSFAILPAPNGTGYVFMGTKINGNGNEWQPKKDGNVYKYFFLTGNVDKGNNPKLQLKAVSGSSNLPEATPEEPYEVRSYTFKVKTPLSEQVLEATMNMTEYNGSATLLTHVPDKLKRKYVTFMGAYKSDSYTAANAVTTFDDVETANNGRVIWLTYESNMPFESLPKDGSYLDARWYTIRMNGEQEQKNIVYYDSTNDKFITADGSGNARGSNSVLHTGENSAEAMVAFMGDPFELRILSRYASEYYIGNRYIGCANPTPPATLPDEGTILSVQMGSSGITSWEIAADDVDGTIVLRQLGTYDTPRYFGRNAGATNKPVVNSTTSSRIKVVALDKKKYYYHIVRSDGSIAVEASTMQDVGQPLNKYIHIPDTICTPFFNPALGYSPSISFYYTKANADASTSNQNHAPYDGDGVTEGIYAHIYVRYSFGGTLPSRNYNVRLNGQYLYYNSESSDGSKIDSQSADPPDASGADPNRFNYQWHLELTDPYAMTIKNLGFGLDGTFIKVSSWADGVILGWDEASANASKFIVRSSTSPGVFEVMAATGEGVDAATTYYNIGRNTDNTVRMYSNSTYPHGYNQLRFVLTETTASPVDYHLIDKSNHELLVVRSRRSDLTFPADYHSPLVDYHYYKLNQFNVDGGVYTLKPSQSEISDLTFADAELVDGIKHVYVTYDTNSRLNLRKGALYLLKFQSGDPFRQENGADDLTPSEVQAVYPYCNGDCNFFVYGSDEYELQQQGAASTRTRWAWYLESATNDPYHVKICTRQIETYNGYDHQGYFYTFATRFNGEVSGHHVVTSLAWPDITGVHGTEYMVLGSVGQYQLMTTYPVPVDLNGDGDSADEGESAGERQVVKSFEQYWKTYDTVKNKLLKNILEEKDKGANPEGATTVPTDPASYRALLTGTGSGQYGFHSYDYYAYAKRFNGYNASGATSKGWEKIEHWYQTVNMGEGYFDFVSTVISPVLILLDQHGWEVMRKPLPYSDQDPQKEKKKDAIRAYDSPMVKEYYYWASAKKRSGFHQYYQLEKPIGGSDYASTSLGDLPAWGSENVLDAKGNQNDEYVTYTVKDEYLQTYSVAYTTEYDADAKITKITGVTGTGVPFLIQQGNNYAYTNDGSTIRAEVIPNTGGMSQWIIDHFSDPIGNSYLWYLKPNTDIDTEMGYGDPRVSSSINWVNDYRDQAKVKASGFNSWAFDPYNIQITSAANSSNYLVTNATGATLEEGDGAIVGTYGGAAPSVSLGARKAGVTCSWYDSRALDITNTTFMVVQDLAGNMQLMPRFDQTRRVRMFQTLVTPASDASDPTKLPQTYTKLYRPLVYNYHIIDNAGFESLRYKSGGDLVPQTPDHFKSPLAKDFKYYKTLMSTGTNVYDLSTLSDEITESESLAGKGLASSTAAGNDVYVRYSYDEHADAELILKGKWFTMQLNDMDAKYDSGIKQGTSKPSTMNATYKVWQWKFLETPLTDPDPYAVCLFNRDYNETRQNEPLLNTRFALLPHTGYGNNNRVYALARAGRGDYTFEFLNGSGMTTSIAATLAEDKESEKASGFTSTSCTFHANDSKVELIDDILHTYTYEVYTNENVLAIEAEQSSDDASNNDYMPALPSAAMSPLMNDEDFRYYYNNNMWSPKITVTDEMKKQFPELKNVAEIPDTIGKSIKYMYGLYDDKIFVHYMPYNPDNSSFLVPNDKDVDGGVAVRGSRSNDAPLGLDGKLLYNIVWYNDNMMKVYDSNSDDVLDALQGVAAQPLQASNKAFVWKLEGTDPYAIKIKNYEADKYINSTAGLSNEAQTFMLIPQEGYGYGVLAVTGNKGKKLTMASDGSAASVATTDTPTKYVIFALATNTVIYHLMIAKTDEQIYIPYRETYGATLIPSHPIVKGSTQRDLTSKNSEGGIAGEKFALGETILGKLYCKEVGPISLGDKLAVPEVLYRPNVVYEYYVEGIYAPVGVTVESGSDLESELASLNDKYKGTRMEYMGDDPRLVGKRVFVNVIYTFNGSLDTNAGADFVRSVNQNKWYTFETKKADGTPLLTQYTNAWGTEVKEGRGTHYTNDYLWTPLGDPYGFKMYHRYTCVNSGEANTGEPNRVMTTIDNTGDPTPGTGPFAEGKPIVMGSNEAAVAEADSYCIYELLEGSTEGYFKIHPVANTSEQTQYYFDIVNALEPGSTTVYHDYVRLSATNHTDFTFGLTDELVKPYYDRAGYVGGLTITAPEGQKSGKQKYEEANGNLMELQSVVYNSDNIVKYEPGYYRLHSPEDIEGVSVRYASGYTHKAELANVLDSDKPVPMHFYEVEGKSSQFDELKSKDGASVDAGYTRSVATRGDIPIPAVEYDPASIFYFYEGSSAIPLSRVKSQGLYLKGRKGPGLDKSNSNAVISANVEETDERAEAIMTETEGEATPLYVMDIGGAILLIHDNITAERRGYLKYLSYDQAEADHIYDLKLTHNTHTDHAKWLMQPANHLGLRVTTHSGGDAGTYGVTYNYSTFYAPFDVMLPDTVKSDNVITKIYHAVVLDSKNSPWNPTVADLHPHSIGRYNIAANFDNVPSRVENGRQLFLTNDRFVPACTPVLMAMLDNVGYVKLTLPNSSPHPMKATIDADTRRKEGDVNKDTQGERTNILSGEYLEQKLELDNTQRVYTFGLPFSGAMSMNESTGYITATLPLQDNSGMGFYINANPDKELGLSRGDWDRNNWYVYANKVYYLETGRTPSSSRETRGVEYVPVVFDFNFGVDVEEETDESGAESRYYDNRVYDLQGRCVATEQQVKDGSWRQNLVPGVYIVNGKKMLKK